MRQYDFSPLYRSFVGFDRMANLIDAASQQAIAIRPIMWRNSLKMLTALNWLWLDLAKMNLNVNCQKP